MFSSYITEYHCVNITEHIKLNTSLCKHLWHITVYFLVYMSSLSITEHFTVLRCGHHHITLLCFIIHIYRSLIIPLCYCVCIPGTLQGAIVTFRFENYEAAWTRSIISPFFFDYQTMLIQLSINNQAQLHDVIIICLYIHQLQPSSYLVHHHVFMRNSFSIL